LELAGRRCFTTTYLDTVDWRLSRQGLTLTHESDPGADVLVLIGPDEVHTTRLTAAPAWPARSEQLAPGSVRDRVAPAMWIRAVSPVIATGVVSREVTARNEDEKIVARILWQETTEAERPDEPPVVRVLVDPLRGYTEDGAWIARELVASGEFAVASHTLAEEWLWRARDSGAERGGVAAGMPADVAVATALLGFLDAVEGNVAGTIDDVDTEFLHDLRVAVRRTRSVLKLTGDVLPAHVVEGVAEEFKWLGDVTTPTRDLDVYLLELDDLAKLLTVGAPADLEDFAAHVQRERAKARRDLVRALRSQRFARLCAAWRQGLAAVVDSEPESQADTVERLARKRVLVAYRRVTKRADALTPASPAEDVHMLRKRAKELRYLLEVFAPVCDPGLHRALVRRLKRLQTVLGEFQDGEVQSAALRVFAERMVEARSARAATLLAMGELSARFAGLQHQARDELTAVLPRSVGPKLRRKVGAMLP
jgi:CHAD domain-containing protein